MSLALWLFACAPPHEPSRDGAEVDDAVDGTPEEKDLPEALVSVSEDPQGLEAPRERRLEAAPEPSPPEVTLGSCLVPDCPFSLTFSEPMRTDVLPVLALEPAIEGRFSWRDATTLLFTPARGALGHGTEVKITIEQAAPLAHPELSVRGWSSSLVVPPFTLAGKTAWWPVVRGEPRFVGFLNHTSLQVGSGPLLAIYDQPVDPETIAERLNVTHEDKALSFRVLPAPKALPRATSEPIPAGHVLSIFIRDLPADGQALVAAMPTWDEEGFISESWELTVRRTLAISAAEFSDDSRAADDVRLLPPKTKIELVLSGSVEQEIARKAIQIAPAPQSAEITSFAGKIHADLSLSPGTDYTLTAASTLEDALGNKLGAPFSLRFRSRDLPPELSMPILPVVTEKDRANIELRALNLARLEVRAIPITPEAYTAASSSLESCSGLSTAGEESLLPVNLPNTPNVRHSLQVRLPRAGLYCLQATGFGAGSEGGASLSAASLVASTDLGLTAKISGEQLLIWVTSLGKPAPMAGADLSLIDADGNTLSKGTSRADGTATLHAGDLAQKIERGLHVVARSGGETAVLTLREERLSSPWQFGIRGATNEEILDVALFTERGVYRPGESAHVAILGGPARSGQSVTVTVADPRGQSVLTRPVSLDSFGMGSLSVETREGAPVGEYRVTAVAGAASTSARYRVEEYRVPTFRVSLRSEEPWGADREATALVSASYLQGGMLDARQMRWELVRTPEPFAPPAFQGFRFGREGVLSQPGSVASGGGRLDGAGSAVVRFKPELTSSTPMRYTLEAVVTDVDRQTQAARISKILHGSRFYLGLRAPLSSVLHEGDLLDVPVVAASPEGKAVGGVNVRVKLVRVEHHSSVRLGSTGAAQVDSRPVEQVLSSCSIVTARVPTSCRLTIPAPGRWMVVAEASDGAGHSVSSSYTFTAGGEEPAPWPRFDRERISIVSDKISYKPGETAHLVVETPFTEALGLLTVERGGVISHEIFTIRKDTPVLDLPIEESHAPNIFASVTILRGRIHDQRDATGFETGAPSFRTGITELRVEPVSKYLQVSVVPMQHTAEPKQEVSATLTVKDKDGVPITGQAVVMVVDEAVLGLTAHRTPDPLEGLLPRAPLAVRSAESRLELPHALRSRREVIFPSGDGSDVLSVLPDDLLRKLFESTVFFDAAVPVKAGHASVRFVLPDQTTTFRVMAVAVDTLGRAGASDAQLLVRKPLSVIPVVPRFVHPGDRLVLEAMVHADNAGPVTIKAEMQGLKALGEINGSVNVPAGGTATMPIEVEVTGKEEVILRLSAAQGGKTDVSERTLPVRSPGNRRTEVASAALSGGEQVLSLKLPEDRVPGSEDVEIVASTTALTELKDAVGYLMGYPNGCIEQTTSRAYPLVVLEDLLPEIGVEVDRAELRKYSEAGVQRILSFQTDAGGLSYWPGGGEPHAFATAFGLTALIEAKERGYDVPDESLDKMGQYLIETLSRTEIREDIPHGGMADGDTRALFVMTLGRLGHPQPALLERLWSDRRMMTPFGLSLLAVAAREIDPDHPLLAPIQSAIAAEARRDAGEAWFDGDRKGGYSMDSPLRTHAASLLAFSSGEALGAPLLTGLLARREDGMWGNTQENVFGIMGVRALMGQAGGEGPKVELSYNGSQIDLASMASPSPRVRSLHLAGHTLAGSETQTLTGRALSGPPVRLALRASYDLQLTEANRQPKAQGMVIERRIEDSSGRTIDTSAIPLGALVRIRLLVSTEQDLNYVAVEDLLPAGFEPLNSALATTERGSLGPPSAASVRTAARISYSEIRDHRVAFYMDALPAGTYELRYLARATTKGRFLRPAARAEAMYAPEIYAVSAIDEVTVR